MSHNLALTPLQRQRLAWVQLLDNTQDAEFVCRRCGISRATLRKWVRRYVAGNVSVRHEASQLPPRRWRRKAPTRYSRPIPGDRVQVDVCKIGPGLDHYAAIADCTRYRVMGLDPRRAGTHTIAFLERVIEEMPFAIQRIQTDRGR